MPLVLSAGFHVRTGLSLGLDRLGDGARLADELGPDERIVEVLAERLGAAGATVDYREYPDVEHMVIVQAALDDVFRFLDTAAAARR